MFWPLLSERQRQHATLPATQKLQQLYTLGVDIGSWHDQEADHTSHRQCRLAVRVVPALCIKDRSNLPCSRARQTVLCSIAGMLLLEPSVVINDNIAAPGTAGPMVLGRSSNRNRYRLRRHCHQSKATDQGLRSSWRP